MTRWLTLVVLALFWQSTALAVCPNTSEPYSRANWMRERKEYHRAVGAYLDLLYAAHAKPEQVEVLSCLADTYLEAGQNERALEVLEQISDLFGAAPPAAVRLNLAEAELRSERYADAARLELFPVPADPQLQKRRDYLLARAQVGLQNWRPAFKYFAAAQASCSTSDATCAVTTRNVGILRKPPLSVSPGLALVLSAVVPGTGMFYTRHPIDAITYTATIGLFSFLTLDTTDFHQGFGSQRASTYILGGLTVLFYVANLWSTYASARRQNQVSAYRYRQQLLRASEQTLLPVDWPTP